MGFSNKASLSLSLSPQTGPGPLPIPRRQMANCICLVPCDLNAAIHCDDLYHDYRGNQSQTSRINSSSQNSVVPDAFLCSPRL